MPKFTPLAFVLGLVFVATPPQLARGDEFDILLLGGRVVDGTGAPWYEADVGVRDGQIVAIGLLDGNLHKAAQRLHVRGLVVAPGFVDVMGQTAEPWLDTPGSALSLLTQGITTINAGEGHSPAPLNETDARRAGWSTMAEYFQLLDMKGLPTNVVQTVGHTQVRRQVLGDRDIAPTDAQLEQMKAHVREAMQAGAIGLSTALIYPPAVYADREEISALASVAGEYGGRYYTHMRNEGDRLLEAIDEAIEIGQSANTPVHIFHLKAAGRQNWPKMELAIAKIKAARAAGHAVAADMYPYINNGLGIRALIHPKHFAKGEAALLSKLDDAELRKTIRDEMENQGGWENWFRHMGNDWGNLVVGQVRLGRYSRYAGKSLAEIAAATKQDPWDTFFDLAKTGVFVLPQTMSEANKERLMKEEFISFCTDFGPSGGGRNSAHPRAMGAFPRVLAHYVRDREVITLERAVAQASSVATNEVMAFDRGVIAEGLAADIIVFDPEEIADRATFSEPQALSTGMKHVIVNGQLVLKDGARTDARPGRVLRGPGHIGRREEPTATGKADPRMASFDKLMREFIERHHVPGAALAVLDRGRLVYARGYGHADIATREPATPQSLFRIASISKPITAVAIMKLAEEKKLRLDDKIFDMLEFDPYLENESDELDGRQREITIRQLLQHRGGWDRDASFDPMFRPVAIAKALGADPPATAPMVIRYMSGKPLDSPPGERYAYSNYGYNLLGRVIEKLSGQSYEAYVKAAILKPLGIHSMRIGKTVPEGRAEGEVRYYDPARGNSVFAANLGARVLHPYGAWHLEAMDSHGGWIASAVDLAKFASAFADSKSNPVLNERSIAEMFSPPQNAAEKKAYACGWFVRPVAGGQNRWHTGSLPGTATLMVLRHDQKSWVVLLNSRVSPQIPHLTREIDPLLHRAADAVSEWPDIDLFKLGEP